MTYEDFIDKLGQRYTFSYGELVESASGEVVVSTSPARNTIYLNKRDHTAQLIIDPKLYIGRKWRIFTGDCVTLAAEYLDDHIGSSLKKIRHRAEYDKYFKEGMCQWFIDHGFQQISSDAMQPNDVLVVSYGDGIITHTCVYLGDNKILHHLSKKYSSIDPLDASAEILGVFRYAQ